MFALKPRTETIARILLIAVIVFNAFVPTAAAASSSGENQITTSDQNTDDLSSSITLGDPSSDIQEQVPILSEQIAKQAQQQEEKPIRFKVSAEPAIYTPGQPISLQWKVQNMKPEIL